jgi:hypothetical protein
MKTKIFLPAVVLILACLIPSARASEGFETIFPKENKHTLSYCPFASFVGIYAIHYFQKIDQRSEFIVGLSYMNIKFEGSGHTNSPALILGYRRYFWKGLHLEYEIWPAFDSYYEKNENRRYNGFDLWNEFRLGYKYEFRIAGQQLHANLQMPFGFGLYASNKPESFQKIAENDKYFYFPPLLSFGISF